VAGEAIQRPRSPETATPQRAGLDLEGVEQSALDSWRGPRDPYWVTIAEAAAVLGVSGRRVRQLVAKDFLPAVQHHGSWLYRRRQVEVIARARSLRHHPHDSPST
jgi:excisionase family DNA binding protein